MGEQETIVLGETQMHAFTFVRGGGLQACILCECEETRRFLSCVAVMPGPIPEQLSGQLSDQVRLYEVAKTNSLSLVGTVRTGEAGFEM